MRKNMSSEEKSILLSIPILFLFGASFHFLYEISGNNFLVGLIAPVNESVWEHTKMVVVPIILWRSLFYLLHGKRLSIEKNPWHTGLLASLLISIISIPFLYYFYVGAFGVSILWVDILIFLISLSVGQLLGLHVYQHSHGIAYRQVVLIIFFILILYFIATVRPPNIPLFQVH